MKVNFGKTSGKIKPMNAVNNGPAAPNDRLLKSNFELYKSLKIPYARTHDSSYFITYGGEHTVDVHRIFKNFDADENDPVSYIFEPTDYYLKNIEAAGTKVFYRLGASIEHGYKYGTIPPKDNLKWARICEHIIRHYTEGWANGFYMDIEYWEIWNEPDCFNSDGSNPCWQGTIEEFFEFYATAAKYLKEKFPKLKIGGPAIAYWYENYSKQFLNAMVERNVPLDFFSIHWYGSDAYKMNEQILDAKRCLLAHGYDNTELILNEFNYAGNGWDEATLKTQLNLKGAALISSAMAISQASPLDMLMYYGAQPLLMNGILGKGCEKLKGYYIYSMFAELMQLGGYAESEDERDIFSCAATNGDTHAIMVTHYSDDDKAPAREVKADITLPSAGKWRVEYILLNDMYDNTLIHTELICAESFSAHLNMPVFSTYFLRITKCD